MDKKLMISLAVLMVAVGAAGVVYGIATSITYTVTVHDTTTYAANIQLTSPTQINVTLNEGEVATSTITLHNSGNLAGSATLSASGQLPAHFEGGPMTTTVNVPAGQSVDVTLYIPAPTDITGDTEYTVTVALS